MKVQFQYIGASGIMALMLPIPDRLWNAIVNNGGQESDCGWCKDKWGVSWQITPKVLIEAINDSDSAAAKRAFDAMMTMQKIDIATIENAWRGENPNR